MSCPHGNWGDCSDCAQIDEAFNDHAAKVAALTQQRDELLAALKEAKPLLEQFDTSLASAARRQSQSIETASYIGKGFDVARCIQKIETAIAKAEGRGT